MQIQDRSGASDNDVAVSTSASEETRLASTPVPRRQLIRALPGVALAVAAVLGLAGCGGEDADEDEDEDD